MEVGVGGVCETEDPSVNESRRSEASAMTPPTSTFHFEDLSAWRAPRHLLVSSSQLQTRPVIITFISTDVDNEAREATVGIKDKC